MGRHLGRDPDPSEVGFGFNNHTLRMNPRMSIGDGTLRVRVSDGTRKLTSGTVYA